MDYREITGLKYGLGLVNGASLVTQMERIHLQCRKPGFDPWVGKIPWGRKQQPIPVFLPRELHRQKSLAGYSPWGCKESGTTERLHFIFEKGLWPLTKHDLVVASVFCSVLDGFLWDGETDE